ncbi:hypothetical protein [uncultured Deefgea sp.]|uniref:hypothetical protein n=1 Tax=uncultured Deefgea sp. TaxID=1304914 RepID=UPI00262C6766|nr:hypothetical protein [uncultured Deefgea sp.]
MREFFLNYGLPFLVIGALGGGIIYLFCAQAMYSYLKNHYSDALPLQIQGYMMDGEAAGGFISGTWYAFRNGAWRRIESNTWRKFFFFTQGLGGFTGICCIALCASFIFWPSR